MSGATLQTVTSPRTHLARVAIPPSPEPLPLGSDPMVDQATVRLDRHKAHVRPLHCFGNSFGIKVVVLVGLQKWLYELCRHKAGHRAPVPSAPHQESARRSTLPCLVW